MCSRTFVFCLLTFGLLCGNARAGTIFLRADLNGANEVPPVVTPGIGISEVAVSDDQQSIFVTLLVSGLLGQVAPGTGVYGAADVNNNGPLVFSLLTPFPSFQSGILTGQFDLPGGPGGQVYSDLIAGKLYINVFTNAIFGAGFGTQVASRQEIRGQILMTDGPVFGVPEPSTWAMLALGLAGIGYAANRRRADRMRRDA